MGDPWQVQGALVGLASRVGSGSALVGLGVPWWVPMSLGVPWAVWGPCWVWGLPMG